MQKIMFKGYQWIRKSDVVMLCLITKNNEKTFLIGELFRINSDNWTWVSFSMFDWVPVSTNLVTPDLNIAKSMLLDMVVNNITDCFEAKRKKTVTLLNVFNRGEF